MTLLGVIAAGIFVLDCTCRDDRQCPNSLPHLECHGVRLRVLLVPADPAAEQFDYPVAFDVRELVTLDDVMDEMDLGPNGCAPWFWPLTEARVVHRRCGAASLQLDGRRLWCGSRCSFAAEPEASSKPTAL